MRYLRRKTDRPLIMPLGRTLTLSDTGLGDRLPFVADEGQLSRHTAIFGGSRFGKSKLMELLCRQAIDNYRGFCFIDAHGDTSEDLLVYAHERSERLGTDAICKRIHYLEPSFEWVFGFDPFLFTPPPDLEAQHHEAAYLSWLHTKVDQIAAVVQRKQGQSDFQGMARLQRILRDVLIAVGTAVDSTGKHLSLSDVLVLLDAHHPRHRAVLDLLIPSLPSDVRGDFLSIDKYKSEEQRKREIESTINRLRSLLSPLVKAIFAAGSKAIDFRSVIENGEIVLVNLRRTDFFSGEQRNAIGGLIINEILSKIETAERKDRVPFYLFVDEAKLFIGEDLLEALDQSGKWGLAICLAGQHLGQFRTKEFDMTQSILNNCANVITFQQKHPDDIEVWKKYFGYPNLQFSKHFQIVDRQKGYDVLEVTDWSETESTQKSVSVGESATKSVGHSHQSSLTEGIQQGDSWSAGSHSGDGQSKSRSLGRSEDWRLRLTNSRSDSESRSSSTGLSRSISGSRSNSESHSEANTSSESMAVGSNRTEGRSVSTGTTINHKLVPVPHLIEEAHETPHLINSVSDQFDRHGSLLSKIPRQVAFARLADSQQSVMIRIADVKPVAATKEEFVERLATMKAKVMAEHAYYSRPSLSVEEEEHRLQVFLELETAPPAAEGLDPSAEQAAPKFGI